MTPLSCDTSVMPSARWRRSTTTGTSTWTSSSLISDVFACSVSFLSLVLSKHVEDLASSLSNGLNGPTQWSLCFFSAPVLDGSVSDGASLVYTSVKEMKNLDVLYKYLVHRLYGFPFHCAAQVVERDAVFM